MVWSCKGLCVGAARRWKVKGDVATFVRRSFSLVFKRNFLVRAPDVHKYLVDGLVVVCFADGWCMGDEGARFVSWCKTNEQDVTFVARLIGLGTWKRWLKHEWMKWTMCDIVIGYLQSLTEMSLWVVKLGGLYGHDWTRLSSGEAWLSTQACSFEVCWAQRSRSSGTGGRVNRSTTYERGVVRLQNLTRHFFQDGMLWYFWLYAVLIFNTV